MKTGRTARRTATKPAQLLCAGETLLERGEYDGAASNAKAILTSDSNHLGALELLARSLWRSGNFESALDSLRHLIRINPYEPGYHYMKAVALQSLGYYGEAIRSFGRCLASENESLSQTAAASIRDLESWQEDVIAELLQSDRGFHAAYSANAMKACHERGFAFSGEDAAVSQIRVAAEAPRALAWNRPS